MTDYEFVYQRESNACGEPFKEMVHFFHSLEKGNLQVLDLGCGQGRDALFIAKKGHSVLGIDISVTGIKQMCEAAQKDRLPIEGKVADAQSYIPSQHFDIVVIDRLLHIFNTDNEKVSILSNMSEAILPKGYILIADTPNNKKCIKQFFETQQWHFKLDTKNFTFVQKQ